MRLRNYAKETIRHSRVNISEFLNFCITNRNNPIKLDKLLAKQYHSYLKSKYSPGRINGALASLRGYFNYLVANELVTFNYFNSLHNHSLQANPPKSIPFSQLKLLLERIDKGQYNSLKDIAVFELIYGSGIKTSELVNLTDADLDLPKEEIRVRTRRVRYWETRSVYLPAGTIYILKKYLTYKRMRWPTSQYLFPKCNGKKYISNYPTQIIKSMLGRNNGSKVLRNTYIQILLSNGADIKYVKELVGLRSAKALMGFKHSAYLLREEYEKSFPREKNYRNSNS